jgi:hypothetical protein
MKFLLALLVGLAWTFLVTLTFERPDMARTIPAPWPNVMHGVFAVVLLLTVWGVSAEELRRSSARWSNAPGVWLRNLFVLAMGLAVMVFTWHLLLQGIDPTGVRRLW